MKLRAALLSLLHCLVSTTWSQETFEEAGASGRGPRILEQKSDTACKQEINWQVCSDDDWGPKCPSGCRVQGLSEKTDKEFQTRIDAIEKKLKDDETNYESIDLRIKETYKLIKDKLVAAQQSEVSYNQVSNNLRQKIDILKVKISSQIERIKLLQKNIRDQVMEWKRLEVDIDIKLRACKGSCAKGVDVHVDFDSYEDIQKQLLQAESTNLRPDISPSLILKMKPMKDSNVDSRYKTLAQEKETNPIFSDIDQYSFVLEENFNDLTMSPSFTTHIVYESAQSYIPEVRVISCTKTITKKIIKGPNGTREEISEVISGGEECKQLVKLQAEGKVEVGADGTYTIRNK